MSRADGLLPISGKTIAVKIDLEGCVLFNSWPFLPFIIIVLVLYYNLPFRLQNRMLLAASCIFYGAWNWFFLLLLLGSTSVDYIVALRIGASDDISKRKRLLAVSMAANLGILGFFKYSNFFIGSAAAALSLLHLHVSMPLLRIILPVGISFYTFHAMSYNIDVYRKQLKPISCFWDYLLFVLFFPQLVAGPIARAHLLLPQVTHPRKTSRNQVVEGCWLFFWGLFKKIAVADNLAAVVESAFGPKYAPGGAQCLIAVYAFALQIYCDFSGYTDMARGLGKLMGFELTMNFNLPYIARNPAEFWHRWHISLSTWLRDYLYISIGGSRNGRILTYRNLMITMLLGGLWHGAAWNFVIWGGYHGLLLCLHRAYAERFKHARRFGRLSDAVSIVVMFHLTCLGWLFFRARSLQQIREFATHIVRDRMLDVASIPLLLQLVLFGGMLFTIEGWIQNSDDPRTRPLWRTALAPAAVTVMLLMMILFAPHSAQTFLYFQF